MYNLIELGVIVNTLSITVPRIYKIYNTLNERPTEAQRREGVSRV